MILNLMHICQELLGQFYARPFIRGDAGWDSGYKRSRLFLTLLFLMCCLIYTCPCVFVLYFYSTCHILFCVLMFQITLFLSLFFGFVTCMNKCLKLTPATGPGLLCFPRKTWQNDKCFYRPSSITQVVFFLFMIAFWMTIAQRYCEDVIRPSMFFFFSFRGLPCPNSHGMPLRSCSSWGQCSASWSHEGCSSAPCLAEGKTFLFARRHVMSCVNKCMKLYPASGSGLWGFLKTRWQYPMLCIDKLLYRLCQLIFTYD